MSIKAMIADHPQVPSDYDSQRGETVKHAMYCAAICNSCADSCSAEPEDMARCIRLCMDCSDMCTATYRIATRHTSSNPKVLEAALNACITACEVCADECEKHDNAHCRRCAQMCRECIEDCRKALAGMKQAA